MRSADGGSGSFRVDPEALVALGGSLFGEAGRTREVVAQASGGRCVTTGSPALGISRFFDRWTGATTQLADVTEGFGGAVVAASYDYVDTDRSVMPRSGPR